MRTGIVSITAWCAICGAALPVTAADKDIVAKALAARAGIVRMQARVEYKKTDSRRQPQETSRSFVVWQTPDRYRADITRRVGGNSREADAVRRFVVCDNCERPGWAVTGNDGMLVVQLHPPMAPPRRMNPARMDGIDLKFLGMGNRPYPSVMPMDDGKPLAVLADPEYQGFRTTEVMPDGSVRLEAKSVRTGGTMAVWVSPDLGYAITRMTLTRTDEAKQKTYTSDLVCTGHRGYANGLHYPSHITLTSATDGVPHWQEQYTVSDVRVNEPIDDAVFTVAGMGFSDGKPVLTPDSPGLRNSVRDGKVAPVPPSRSVERSPAPPPTPVDPNAGGGIGWGYAAAAVACAALGVFLVRRLLTRR